MASKREAGEDAGVGKEADDPRKKVTWKEITDLDLDPKNPRLPDGMARSSQPTLLETMAKEYELQDLGQSIADNGYFSEEPLVVVKVQNKERWTVVEGNRRLAALKLLDDPDTAPQSYRKRWSELSKSRKEAITEVPVLVYTDRKEIVPYLGFRHITGVLAWKPYQKARYITQLVEDMGYSFAEIARTIGSKTPTVREHYVAFSLLRQARDAFSLDTANVEESFGVLRRSLSDPKVREYIGVQLDRTEKELAHPVPKKKAEQVEELFSWMFGVGAERPVLHDSRDIKKLGVVLAKSEAVEVLRRSGDLDYAFELSGGEETRLVEMLEKASYFLDQSLPMAIRHKRSKQVISAVQKCAIIFKEMRRQFPTIEF